MTGRQYHNDGCEHGVEWPACVCMGCAVIGLSAPEGRVHWPEWDCALGDDEVSPEDMVVGDDPRFCSPVCQKITEAVAASADGSMRPCKCPYMGEQLCGCGENHVEYGMVSSVHWAGRHWNDLCLAGPLTEAIHDSGGGLVQIVDGAAVTTLRPLPLDDTDDEDE